jgi:hypothetical protein
MCGLFQIELHIFPLAFSPARSTSLSHTEEGVEHEPWTSWLHPILHYLYFRRIILHFNLFHWKTRLHNHTKQLAKLYSVQAYILSFKKNDRR